MDPGGNDAAPDRRQHVQPCIGKLARPNHRTQGPRRAVSATQANRPDDAIAWLQLNLEYFPASSRTYAALSQAQQRKTDKEAAIKSLEKAVQLDPQNAQFKRQLDQLKGQ